MKLVIVFCCALMLFSCNEKVKQPAEAEKEEEMVIDEIIDVEQDRVAVYDFTGLEEALLKRKDDTTYVVNFWATWCKPCIKELPYFERLGSEYKAQNVKVVLVTLDFPEYLTNRVIPFMDEYELQSEVIMLDDPVANTWINKVSEAWSGAIPATLIFNSEQRKFYEQQFTYEQLEEEVKSIL